MTPVIISDSKGLCLKGQSIDQASRQIKWWCASGAKTQDRLKWFQSSIAENIKSLGNLSIYVWLGTCNLTTRGKSGFISLTSQNEDTVQFILDKYQDFINIIGQYPESTIKVYPITKYNKNECIRYLNETLNSRSPNFSIQLQSRRPRSRSKNKPTEKYFNYNLYSDGIHPQPLLAKTWIKELVEQIQKNCWW